MVSKGKANVGKGKSSTKRGVDTTSRVKTVTQPKKTAKPKNEKKKEGKSAKSNSAVNKGIYPSADIAFKALLSARFCAAMWSNISDCDETFNYWEPSHFLLYGKGFQTWEYSPEYALRSYTYLLLHVLPAWIYANILQPNRMLIFYFVRCLLGLFCAFCESYFYKSVCKEFGVQVGRLVLVFLLFSPGMFISSTAYLPSSFSMYMTFLSTAAWIVRKYELAIFSVALSTFISWPFAALIGLPIAIDMIFIKKYYRKFIQWAVISSVIILVPIIKMDSELYGRFVIAPLNIVTYNIFSNNGPNLYGTEPICFYFINGFLNFNMVFIAAIFAPSVIEERFLFPVYPLICLCGAICIHSMQVIYSVLISMIFGKNAQKLPSSRFISIITAAGVVVLALSRILALYKGYHAPMDIYMELNKMHAEGKVDSNVPVNVCVGKEWYRFPTSFFLPNNNWNLKFLQSEFKGQLPAEYSSLGNATAIVHSYFNDMNREEPSRYFKIDQCHFIIDCNYGRETKLEPNYDKQTDKWTPLITIPFLDVEKSSTLFRSFYIPFVTTDKCSFAKYTLYKSNSFKLIENQ
ncbi:hypothetical protein RUM44_012770 [Polyplax serrata]|uniref:Mannosyltransferase n=1 Tax=Polyplax serrata TaxID=468196 RepID=A0ABR1BC92_POLSC